MPKNVLSRILLGLVLIGAGLGLFFFTRQHSGAQRLNAILSLNTDWYSIRQPWYSVLMVASFVLGLLGLGLIAHGVAKR
jgi:hypothetical protein